MSFPRYPTYQDSGVEWLGEVPGHWGVKRLRFVAELNPSKSEIGALDRDTAVSFLPMEAIGDDGTLNLDKEKTISEVESGYTYFRDGDVTVAKITPCYENGKGAQMKGLVNGIGFGTTELIVVRPRPNQLIGSYLHYLFISPDFRGLGESHMYGAGGQKRVPDAFVRNFATAFPPVPEQTQIAAFLDRETAKIDELVAEQRRLMELLKEKRQAVISHAVTQGLNPDAPMKPSGIEWLGDVPAHWEVTRIKKLCSVISKGTTPTTVGADFTLDGIRFLKAENITAAGVDEQPEFYISEETHAVLSRSSLQDGDVLVVIAGATTGKSAVLNKELLPANTNQAVSFIRPKENRFSPFISLWLGTHLVRKLISLTSVQSAQPNLSMEDLGNIPFPVPPFRELNEILVFLATETAKFDTLTAEAQRAIDLLQERRTALISAAVTGQIDVRGVCA